MAFSILFMSAKNCESIEHEIDYANFEKYCHECWAADIEWLPWHDLGIEMFSMIEFNILHILKFKFSSVSAFEVVLTIAIYLEGTSLNEDI